MPVLKTALPLLLTLALAAAGQTPKSTPDDPLDAARRALDAHPDDNAARMNLALAYYKKGDLTHARQQAETLHQAAPHDIPAAVLLSYIYVKMDRESEVVDLLTPLEAGQQGNNEFEYSLGFSLIQTGKVKEGAARMEKVAQATHSANAYVIAGSALLQRGYATPARIDLEAAAKLDPSIPGLSTLRGQADYAQQDMEAAATAFHAALRENPRDFDANLDLGAIRLKAHDYDTARPLLELALELQPNAPMARMEMAKLDEVTGKYAEAAGYLEALVKAEPDWLDAHWELANVYYALERPADAKRERAISQDLKLRQQKP
jgi:Tfp pilus assembly protein PilF